MRRLLQIVAIALVAMAFSYEAFATNGDNLIAIGPNARAMGGTGIAAPQDAISAVFANPAAMCFTPGCAYSEVNFSGSMFLPHPSGEVDLTGFGSFKADSKENVYAIPAIGLSMPIDPETRRWRFGLAAYGVTGLGVDYRGTALDQSAFFPDGSGTPTFPLVQGEYTSLLIMKFAPALAYQVTPEFSVGLAAHIDYATLDLRNGSSPAYGFGVQVGAMYRPTQQLTLGIVYISPQRTDFQNVLNYNGTDRELDLESPQTIGAGIAYTLMDGRLLLTVDGRWLNWSDAKGYSDFDWEDQYVVAAGAQFAVIPKKFFVRCGFNYGNNPVVEHNGWGTGVHNVQGMIFPDYYYETFRVIGFPAIVETHVTVGVGYAFSEKLEINVGYTHAFEKEITETGTAFGVIPATIKSTLSEDSVDFGLTWRF